MLFITACINLNSNGKHFQFKQHLNMICFTALKIFLHSVNLPLHIYIKANANS